MICNTAKWLSKIFLVAIISALSVPVLTLAANRAQSGVQADVVWSESDGLRHELFSATQQDGKWSEPVQVTDDNADNLHPCLDTGLNGKKWLVWTAIEQGGYEIRYAVKTQGKWSEPQALPSELSSNIAPTVVVSADIPWVVWAGNNGVYNDEIFYTRYLDGKWQKPQLVNQANDVPDVLPVIAITSQGQYQVTWEGYRDGRYRSLRVTWTGNGWGPEEWVDEETMQVSTQSTATDKQNVLPDFVKDVRQAFIRTYSDR